MCTIHCTINVGVCSRSVTASEGRENVSFGMQSKLAALDHLKGGASCGQDFDHVLSIVHTASEQKLANHESQDLSLQNTVLCGSCVILCGSVSSCAIDFCACMNPILISGRSPEAVLIRKQTNSLLPRL